MVDIMVKHIKPLNIDVIVGLDSRGFLFGPWLASALKVSFCPVRKQGKLPPPTQKVSYQLEYGHDAFEISVNAIKEGANVLVVDDLIATGGSAFAAGQLVELCGGNILEFLFIIELLDLKGSSILQAPTFSLFKF